MCCRLRLDTRELHHRGGGLFGAQPLTGSIGVVTLNLPRAAYLAKDEVEVLHTVDRLLRLAVESLETKRRLLERLTDEQLYPYAKYCLRSVKERTGRHWSNHFATIGIVGLHEAALNLLGVGLDDPKWNMNFEPPSNQLGTIGQRSLRCATSLATRLGTCRSRVVARGAFTD